jgi:hypothetical protein
MKRLLLITLGSLIALLLAGYFIPISTFKVNGCPQRFGSQRVEWIKGQSLDTYRDNVKATEDHVKSLHGILEGCMPQQVYKLYVL